MGILKNQLETSKLGLNGKTPANRAGASADNDIHFTDGDHVGGHTNLDKKVVNKYIDNKPE